MAQGGTGAAGRYGTEAPTWVLLFTIYGGWLALTAAWHALPLWCGVPLAAWLCAWHMSLQHECIHGHPTRNARLNGWLASAPLILWLPYGIYRDAHLLHHRAEYLTDPLEDSETTYMCPQQWARAGAAARWLHLACNTAAGRVVLGPARAIFRFWIAQARLGLRGEVPWREWLCHGACAGLVLGWAHGVCGIGLATYAAAFVYPGTALIMIRSLAEHRAAVRPADRTAVVERAGLLGLLFLNNNLHLLHHERPGVAWHALPEEWRRRRAELLGARRGPVYAGYLDVIRRYGVRPHHAGPHPFIGTPNLADAPQCMRQAPCNLARATAASLSFR